MSDTHNPDLGISAEHWAIVENAPVAAFLLVAGADGKVDRKELKVFAQRVTAVMVDTDECPVMSVAVHRISDDLEDRLTELSTSSAKDLAKLVAVSRHAVSEDAGAAAAQTFSESLYSMAYQVARASGGLLSLRSRIDRNEKMVLDGLRRILKLP